MRLALPTRMLWRALVALTLALLLLGSRGNSMPVDALERDQRMRALLATVQVIVPDRLGRPFSTGSGTVLDAEQGFILTNFHVLGDTSTGRLFNPDGVAVIGVNPPNLRSAPVMKYRARMINGDPQVDLAVLQIVAPFDNPSGPLPANLGLVDIERAVSGSLMIGDPIYVLGFPGLGGDTVTFTSGIVSGFLDEDRDGLEEWIKTDAEVNRGNSGGLAVNEEGKFVGVPSNGRTDSEAAGKISLIRPADLALGYYDRWTAALTVADPAAPQVSNIVFGSRLDASGRVSAEVSRFGTGPVALYVTFDYENLPGNEPLTYRWLVDGRELSGGVVNVSSPSGSQTLSISNETGLPGGLYELELMLGSRTLARRSVAVGSDTESVSLGPIIFARSVRADGSPVESAAAFGNVGEILAIFPARGLRNGVLVRATWRFNGDVVLDEESPWSQGEVTTAWLSISHPSGLPPGDYELTIDIDGRRAQSGTFAVTENSTGMRPITVNVIGTVRDSANSRNSIYGATVFLLQPGVTLDDWGSARFDERLVYARGSTMADGTFQLDRRVESGRSYAVLVIHEEYRTAREEAWTVPAGASDPWSLTVELEPR